MRGRPVNRCFATVLVAVWTVVACGFAQAVTGVVKNADGAPVAGARVCHYQFAIEQICAETDEGGRFEILDSEVMPIRVAADGYYYEKRSAIGEHEIVLRGAVVLVVKLVDAATGKPIANGEVDVIYAYRKKVGPFPVSAAGVRIQRVLKPGNVKLIGSAAGYRNGDPSSADLEDGKTTVVVIRLEALPSK